jgi:hypothetical protein
MTADIGNRQHPSPLPNTTLELIHLFVTVTAIGNIFTASQAPIIDEINVLWKPIENLM